MRQFTTKAIMLRRTNYGEADRIVNFLTPSMGKVSAIVKGVRKQRSKLAGGIELFSESDITFLETKGSLARITQARLVTHWQDLVGNLPRMMFAYEVMKTIDRLVPDNEGKEHYDLLKHALAYTNESQLNLQATQVWFWVQLLDQFGHRPDFIHDSANKKLDENSLYEFSLSDMVFVKSSHGEYRADHIKLLRLSLEHSPAVLQKVQQFATNGEALAKLAEQMGKYQLHLK